MLWPKAAGHMHSADLLCQPKAPGPRLDRLPPLFNYPIVILLVSLIIKILVVILLLVLLAIFLGIPMVILGVYPKPSTLN